jgi:hypothetical protein
MHWCLWNFISIWDDNLEKAKPGINSDSEDILGESSQSIEAAHHSWKSLILFIKKYKEI